MGNTRDSRRLEAPACVEPAAARRDPAFDRLTELATELLGVPASVVSLVEDEEPSLVGMTGLELAGRRPSYVFSRCVVGSGAPLAISDARRDRRVCDSPDVETFGVVAYCGVPLTDRNGCTRGSFSVISWESRVWDERDLRILHALAAAAATELALRAADRELEASRRALMLQREGVAEPWLATLQAALVGDGFELLAQPIMGICSGGIPRYELLLRLRADDGDLIPPAAFLCEAERCGLIRQIDRWVFARALRLLRDHHAAGHDISLSINMSARTLGDPTILGDLEAMLAACPVPRKRLIVEVTETAAVINIDRARAVARGLRELGCEFALDDFGSGFASFYYLKHLDFDYVKIDGEFVKSLTHNATDKLVIRSVVEIARGMGVKTIAEFVGEEEAMQQLRELGVDYGQGYHLGHPGPLADSLPALPVPA